MVERDQTMKLNNCERTIFQVLRSKRFNAKNEMSRLCFGFIYRFGNFIAFLTIQKEPRNYT